MATKNRFQITAYQIWCSFVIRALLIMYLILNFVLMILAIDICPSKFDNPYTLSSSLSKAWGTKCNWNFLSQLKKCDSLYGQRVNNASNIFVVSYACLWTSWFCQSKARCRRICRGSNIWSHDLIEENLPFQTFVTLRLNIHRRFLICSRVIKG